MLNDAWWYEMLSFFFSTDSSDCSPDYSFSPLSQAGGNEKRYWLRSLEVEVEVEIERPAQFVERVDGLVAALQSPCLE